MSKDGSETNITVKTVSRTFRFDGYTPRGQEPYIDVYREKLLIDDQGNLLGGAVVSVTRVQWGVLKDRSWNLSTGNTVTALELYEALSLVFDESSKE